MVDLGTPPSTKVRAAEAILAHGAKAIEIEDIEALGIGAGGGSFEAASMMG